MISQPSRVGLKGGVWRVTSREAVSGPPLYAPADMECHEDSDPFHHTGSLPGGGRFNSCQRAELYQQAVQRRIHRQIWNGSAGLYRGIPRLPHDKKYWPHHASFFKGASSKKITKNNSKMKKAGQ